MKKIIISLVLLGAVSLGAMAVMQNRPDEPPVRRTEARHYGNCDRRHCDVSRHHGRHADNCACYRDCGRRRDNCCRRTDYDCGVCRGERCTLHERRHADAPRRHYAPRRDRRSYDDVYLRR